VLGRTRHQTAGAAAAAIAGRGRVEDANGICRLPGVAGVTATKRHDDAENRQSCKRAEHYSPPENRFGTCEVSISVREIDIHGFSDADEHDHRTRSHDAGALISYSAP
jgi:hypothetical protein